MRLIIKFRWAIVALWIVALIVLMVNSPNMAQLIRDKGQLVVADGYPSTIADDIVEKYSKKEPGTETFIVVFHHETGELSQNELSEIEETIRTLEKNKDELFIREITTHFDDELLEEQFISPDRQTLITLLDVRITDEEIRTIRDALNEAIASENLDTFITGNSLISEDVIISSEQGLKKTEVITVIFIVIVLLLVFRSIVTPLVPLITVGMTYLVSSVIVAFLVDQFNFPVSNFTQTFLVAVLFGVGTDYCILLLSRYKEELAAGHDLHTAIVSTYKTAGKTVVYSAIAVIIGFASIGFATFKLYQSAVGVAVGVAILVIALFTIVPFFMATLKKGLFWPVKKEIAHVESKLWGKMGQLTIARPFIALGIVAIITVPLIISYDGELSFNSLDEIGEDYDSVKGFNLVANSFGPGEMMPVQVVIEHAESLKTDEYLTQIELLSSNLSELDHVAKVRSVTRPTGEVLEELYVKKQADEIGKGLREGTDGISTIKDGLQEAATSLQDSKPEFAKATSGITELYDGTKELQSGVEQLGTALAQIEGGVREGSLGAGQLKEGVEQASKEAEKLQQGAAELLEGFRLSQAGLSELLQTYEAIPASLQETQSLLVGLSEPLTKLAENHPQITHDANFAQIQAITAQAIENVAVASGTMSALNTELANVVNGLHTANEHYSQLVGGLEQFSAGLKEIAHGLAQLESGLSQAAAGQQQVVQQIPAVANGMNEIASGQKQLKDGFSEMGDGLDELRDGLEQSSEGLAKIEEGFGEAEEHLTSLANKTELHNSGVYIPEQLLTDDEFQKVFNIYMSDDGKMTTLDVVLDLNPYKRESMDMLEVIDDTVQKSLKDTKLANVNIGIGGVTSINNDLEAMSDADYSKTVMYMMIGIVLILIILLRSLIMPVYLIASLLLTYYSAISVTELIFVNILGYPGINWVTPFFGFVILIALGVDYSIFLMDRFSEYKHLNVKTAILLSMKNMGTVIMSAAVILSGTFAAMLPSGVLSMLQIATLVLSGLLFYALIVLPLFVPVIINLLGRANWWPFIVIEKHDLNK